MSYRGNRYSVPHAYAGKSLVVREPLDAGTIRIFHQQDLIAEHQVATGKGEMVVERAHYGKLCRAGRVVSPTSTVPALTVELTPGPGVGLHHPSPVVELRRCRSQLVL